MSGEYEALNETVNQLRAEFEKMRRIMGIPELCPGCGANLANWQSELHEVHHCPEGVQNNYKGGDK